MLAHQEADALHQPVGHLAAALEGDVVVERQVVEAEAELLGAVLEGVGHLGVLQQRLGGDAADVEADAAHELPLDDGRAQTQLRRANRRHVAPRPRAKHYNVVLISHNALQ